MKSSYINQDLFKDDPKEFFENFLEVQETTCLDLANKVKDIVKPSATFFAFLCLEPETIKKKEKEDMVKYLDQLCSFYGNHQKGTHPKTKKIKWVDPIIQKDQTRAEYDLYHSLMKREEDIKTVRDALGFILADPVLTNLFPNVIKLVKLAAICPFGNASVERVFSLLKLVKNRLRSKVTQKTLDMLIRIKLESPDKLSEAQLTDLSENFRDLLIEKSSTGLTRLLY